MGVVWFILGSAFGGLVVFLIMCVTRVGSGEGDSTGDFDDTEE